MRSEGGGHPPCPVRFSLGLFSAFAVTALLLAVVGLYGLVSNAVSQRIREIGLRLALGASPSDVQHMILRQGASLSMSGAAAGLGIAAAILPVISRAIEDVTIAADVMVVTVAILIGVVLVTGLAALGSCGARRPSGGAANRFLRSAACTSGSPFYRSLSLMRLVR